MAKKQIQTSTDEKSKNTELLFGLGFAILPWLIIPALSMNVALSSIIIYSAFSAFFGLSISSFFIPQVVEKNKTSEKTDDEKSDIEDEIEEEEELEEKDENKKENNREIKIAKILSEPNADIQTLKKRLKKVFESRKDSTLTHEELHEQYLNLSKKVKKFLNNITSAKNWDLSKNQKERNALMIEAILFTDAILARVENDIRDDDEEVNAKSISKRLTNKENEEEGHAYNQYFLHRGVIDFYNILRAKTFPNDKTKRPFPKYNSFYEEGTKDNDMRKLYNTTIKHGLENAYGGSKALRKAFVKDDKIFDEWTRKDSKKTKKFIPFPSKRSA